MRRKGRRLAITTGAIAILVIGVAAFVARDRIAEEWWIYRLGAKDDAIRISAAHHLSDLKCLRAGPQLLKIIEEDERESGNFFGDGSGNKWTSITPIAFCLYQLGPENRSMIQLRLDEISAATIPGVSFDGRETFLLFIILNAWDTGERMDKVEY